MESGAATTRAALPHVHPKVTDDDVRDGQFFLILARDARFDDGAVARVAMVSGEMKILSSHRESFRRKDTTRC